MVANVKNLVINYSLELMRVKGSYRMRRINSLSARQMQPVAEYSGIFWCCVILVFSNATQARADEDAQSAKASKESSVESSDKAPTTSPDNSQRMKALHDQLSVMRDETRERERSLFKNLKGINVTCIAPSAKERKLLTLEPGVEKKLAAAGLKVLNEDSEGKNMPPRLAIDARTKRVYGKHVIVANATLTEPVTLRREHKVTVYATTWQRHRMQEIEDEHQVDEELTRIVDKLADQFVDQYRWSCEHSTKQARRRKQSAHQNHSM